MRSPRLLISVTCLGIGLLAAGGGCGTKAPAITGLTVTVTFPALTLDQLQLAVSTGATQVVSPMLRPAGAGAPLTNPQSISIFLRDSLADQEVTCTATALLGGQPVATGSAPAHLQLHHLVPVAIDLVPSDDAGASDGGDGGDDGGDGAAAQDAADDGDAATTSDAAAFGDVAFDGPKGNGAACVAGTECESTQCVDGVCCGSVCTGICESCNLKGTEGICTPVATGTPTAECVDQLASSCGFDGTCNGNGGCRRYGAGTPCKAASCLSGSLIPASACDGQGSCFTPNAVGCAPYLCDSSGGSPQCRTTCQAGVVGCAGTAVCTAGSCGPKVLKANGDGCVAAADCTSKNCVDGVCCESACTGACVACNEPGLAGMCKPVAASKPDPHKVCKDAGVATCKQNGLCNGAGACALYPATTTCLAGACSGRMVLSVRHCDGVGACVAGADVDCMPYRCDPATTACFTSCTTNAQCSGAPKRTCNASNVCQ